MGRYKFLNLAPTNTEKAIAVLNSFNTGDQTAFSAYVNPDNYIQHNLSAPDGAAAFGGMIQMGPSKGFSAEVIRSFEDGDYVFTHSKYNFFGPQVGFDVFRFENGLIVEHWDNLLPIQEPNPSGRTQLDGATEITDLDKTEANKETVKGLIENVFMKGEMDKVGNYFDPEYLQHNPAVGDGLAGLQGAMQAFAKNGMVMEYSQLHKVLGEGNFVLTLSEGKFGKNEPTAFYDLFRLEEGKIVEHWDVISTIPPKSDWKNENGKF
ncbi:MAG: nuclear transport factor 2 family protein [Bacteroidota bacterium]